jgi:hypothetical protein
MDRPNTNDNGYWLAGRAPGRDRVYESKPVNGLRPRKKYPGLADTIFPNLQGQVRRDSNGKEFGRMGRRKPFWYNRANQQE